MEKTGFHQEETRGEEEISRSQNAEDNLSGLHLSESEPSTQEKKNRKRKKGKKSRLTNDPGENTAIPESASTSTPSPAALQQEPRVGGTQQARIIEASLTIGQALSNRTQNEPK